MPNRPDYLYRQSAVVPYLHRDGELHVVLITSARSGQWGVPKGVVESDLSAAESAVKEAEEEAGARGMVDETLLCEYQYDKWGGTCDVEVFPMRVTELLPDWEEAHFRERAVVPLTEAFDMVKPVLVDVLVQFRQYADES